MGNCGQRDYYDIHKAAFCKSQNLFCLFDGQSYGHKDFSRQKLHCLVILGYATLQWFIGAKFFPVEDVSGTGQLRKLDALDIYFLTALYFSMTFVFVSNWSGECIQSRSISRHREVRLLG